MTCFKCGKQVKGMRLGVDPDNGRFVHKCPKCKSEERDGLVREAVRKGGAKQ